MSNLNSNPATNKASSSMDFDYINKSLEDSSKKTSINKNTPITQQIKEKTIFDGIKDNTKIAENNNLNNFNSMSNTPSMGFNLNNLKSTDNKNSGSTLDKFNFGNISDTNTPQTSSMNIKKPDQMKNQMPNIDFSNMSNKNNPKDLNILDSLLTDLPSGSGNTNGIGGYNMGVNQGINQGMNSMNLNNNANSKINNWDYGYNNNSNQGMNMNNMNNLNNLNTNTQTNSQDYYNLDFLKNNKQPNQGINTNYNMGIGNPMNNMNTLNNMNNMNTMNVDWTKQGGATNPPANNNHIFSGLSFTNSNSNNSGNNGNPQANKNNNILDGLLKF
jgi:hypothetical protein